MHLKSKHFSCTRWTKCRFLGSGYFVLQHKYEREQGGSDGICGGLVLCNMRRRGSSWSRWPHSSAHCGSPHFFISTECESADEDVQGEGRFDDVSPSIP